MKSTLLRFAPLSTVLGVFQWGCGPGCPPSREYRIAVEEVAFDIIQTNFKNDTLATEKEGEVTFDLFFRGNQQFASHVPSFSWGQSAFALSCVGDQFIGFTEQLDSIAFFSDQDYANIPAGESLNDMFEWHTISNSSSWDWYSMDNMIEAMRSGNVISQEAFYETPSLLIRMKDAVKTQGPTKFKVTFFLKNGKELQATTSRFIIE